MAFLQIAVGIDLGAERRRLTVGSAVALERARSLALRWGSRVTLVHSTAADEHWDAERGWVFASGGEHPDGRALLEEKARELVAEGIASEIHLAHERAWLALSRLAESGRADLAIVGKRSVPGLDGRRLGTVAASLLRACPSAVWLVAPDAPPGLGRVMAATDLQPMGDRVLDAAAAVADAFGAQLHVVHALQIPLSEQMEDAQAWIVGARRDAEAAIAQRLGGGGVADKAELHVVVSSPTQAILRGAEHLRPDLVVLGTISRVGLPGLLVGNTAERVLPHLDASLLALKPEGFRSPIADEEGS